jgi:hypothetical protein
MSTGKPPATGDVRGKMSDFSIQRVATSMFASTCVRSRVLRIRFRVLRFRVLRMGFRG